MIPPQFLMPNPNDPIRDPQPPAPPASPSAEPHRRIIARGARYAHTAAVHHINVYFCTITISFS